jgi:hypothetical protein
MRHTNTHDREGLNKDTTTHLSFIEFQWLKVKSKGLPLMTMVREKDETSLQKTETSLEYIEKLAKDQQQAPRESSSSSSSLAREQIPKFKIIHQDTIQDYQKFTGEKEKQYGARPDFLVIKIHLPALVGGEARADTYRVLLPWWILMSMKAVWMYVCLTYTNYTWSCPFPSDLRMARQSLRREARL